MKVNGYEIGVLANLRWANLRGAALREADLRGADLRGADLRGADLRGADLRWADLCEADLCEADLRGADLREAVLRGAGLLGADLTDAKLPPFQICPQEGSFIAYKAISTGVITIEIPAEAKRTSSLVGRKCRAEFVKVLEGPEGVDTHTRKTKYVPGITVHPDSYDDDIRVECTNGIHFFMTLEEAEEWL